jgi:hypothetical protein
VTQATKLNSWLTSAREEEEEEEEEEKEKLEVKFIGILEMRTKKTKHFDSIHVT